MVQAATPSQDKDTLNFSWNIDGVSQPKLSGQGRNSIELIAGAIGSATKIRVTVSNKNTPLGTVTLTVRPSDLALTWFAETYTPRWYKGKALPIANSIVNIVAVPNFISGGKVLSPENLIYRWSVDDEERALVGTGRQVLRVQMSDLSDISHQVSVLVEDTEKQIKKEGEIFLISRSPKVLVYPSTPLGGIESRSAAKLFFTPVRGLLDFLAEPFFFNILSKTLLSYHWNANGVDISGNAQNPSNLSINTSGQESGTAMPVSVNVRNRKNTSESSSQSWTLSLE